MSEYVVMRVGGVHGRRVVDPLLLFFWLLCPGSFLLPPETDPAAQFVSQPGVQSWWAQSLLTIEQKAKPNSPLLLCIAHASGTLLPAITRQGQACAHAHVITLFSGFEEALISGSLSFQEASKVVSEQGSTILVVGGTVTACVSVLALADVCSHACMQIRHVSHLVPTPFLSLLLLQVQGRREHPLPECVAWFSVCCTCCVACQPMLHTHFEFIAWREACMIPLRYTLPYSTSEPTGDEAPCVVLRNRRLSVCHCSWWPPRLGVLQCCGRRDQALGRPL